MVVVLTMIFSLSSIDRGIIPLLVEPIRADLGLSDVQMSLLLGLSFVLLFSLCALPAGYLADIMSRRLLIAISTVFWSIMGILCGLANTFRSEEHTSELQSLMRISYAVFCLKKKTLLTSQPYQHVMCIRYIVELYEQQSKRQ